jgi:hypothetical protein
MTRRTWGVRESVIRRVRLRQQASPSEPSSEVELGAELEQPPGQHLRRSQVMEISVDT